MPEPKYEHYRGDIPEDTYNRLIAEGVLNPDGTKPGSGPDLGMDLFMQLLPIRLSLGKRLKAIRAILAGKESEK